jgi:hypothetical protein
MKDRNTVDDGEDAALTAEDAVLNLGGGAAVE